MYYRNGDTDVYALSPDGSTGIVRRLPEGTKAEIAFAASPDDQRIAVVDLTEQADATQNSSRGYVESLSGSTNRVDLFNNTNADAFRWPVGWHGALIIDAAGVCAGGYGPGYGPRPEGLTPPCSYHVIDAATGSRTATACENASPAASNDYYSLQGLPTAAGTACFENTGTWPGPYTATIMDVDWKGAEHTFKSVTQDGSATLGFSSCYIAPDGSRLACQADASGIVTLVDRKGGRHDLGRRYTVMGWIDASHLLVDIDANTLGVLQPDMSTVISVALAGADKTTFAGALPGGL